MATSKFLRTFRTIAGTPITTATIWLVPQANTYPTGALALTPHATRDGQYYRDNVPDGEYKIYIDPAGGSSPTLYEEEIWIGEARITTISDHFDSADSYKLKTTGIKNLAITAAHLASDAVETAKIKDANVTAAKLSTDAVETAKIKDLNVTNAKIANATILPAKLGQQTVTVVSTTNPTPSYIGQQGRDANGKTYIAVALTGTMWEAQLKNSTGIALSDAGEISINTNDLTSNTINFLADQDVNSKTNLVTGVGESLYNPFTTSNMNEVYVDNDSNIIDSSTVPKILRISPTVASGNSFGYFGSLSDTSMISFAFGFWFRKSSLENLANAFAEGNNLKFWIYSNGGYAELGLVKNDLLDITGGKKFLFSKIVSSTLTFTTYIKVKAIVDDWVHLEFSVPSFSSAPSYMRIYILFNSCVTAAFSNPLDILNPVGLFNVSGISPYVIYKEGIITESNILSKSEIDASFSAIETTLDKIPEDEAIMCLSIGKVNFNNELNANRTYENLNNIIGNEKETTPTGMPTRSNCTVTSSIIENKIIQTSYGIQTREFTIANTSSSRFLRFDIDAHAECQTKAIFGFWIKKTDIEKVAGASIILDNLQIWLGLNGYVIQNSIVNADAVQILANPFSWKKSSLNLTGGGITCNFHIYSLAEFNEYIYLAAVAEILSGTVTVSDAYIVWSGSASFWNGYVSTLFLLSYLIDTEFINPFVLYRDNDGILSQNIMTKGYFDEFYSAYAVEHIRSTKDKIKILKTSTTIYIRSYFDDTRDIVTIVNLANVNNLVSFGNVYLITNTNGNTEAELINGVLIHSPGDDITPWSTENTGYIGANHGFNTAKVTVIHDKTTADIGSIWSDGTDQWYLADVLDSTHLQFSFKTSGVEGSWTATYVISGTTLTHVSGATHTATVNFSALELLQETPITKNVSHKYIVDGKYEIVEDAVTFADSFDIIESYEIIDPSTYVPSYPVDWTSADGWIKNIINYRFQNYGALVIDHTAEILRGVSIGYFGVIQSAPLTLGSYNKRFLYMPRVLENNGYDLKAIDDVTTNPSVPLDYNDTYLEDTANPMDRTVSFLGDTDGTKRVGFSHGYNISVGLGKASERDANNSNQWQIYSSGKSYPHCFSSIEAVQGDIFHAVAFRQYFNPENYAGATAVVFYRVGNIDYVNIDVHQTIQNLSVKIPEYMIGKTITVLDKDDNLTLESDEIVSGAGIIVSVINSYGYINLKLT